MDNGNYKSMEEYLAYTMPGAYDGNSPKALKIKEEALKIERKRAFLVIDMQPSILSKMDDEKLDKLVGNQIQAIRYCASYDVPVVAIEYKFEPQTIGQLVREIKKVRRHKRIIKPEDGAFKHTFLKSYLDKHEIEEVYLMGVNSSACVLDTGYQAQDKRFNIATSGLLIAEVDPDPNNPAQYDHVGWFTRNSVAFML